MTKTKAPLVWAAVGVLGLGLAALSCVAFVALMSSPEDPPPRRAIVSIEQPGASVEDVDRQLAIPLARALADLDAEVEIVARAGRVDALLTGSSEDDVVAQARARMESFEAPDDASPAAIRALPPMRVRWILRGPDAEERARSIPWRVERVPGVTDVVTCALTEELDVVIDPLRAAAIGVDPLAVVDALRRGNEPAAGGLIEAGDREVHVRVTGATDADRLGDIAVQVRDGRVARLRDVASIQRGRAPSGCECVDTDGACGSGAVRVADERGAQAVRAALREELTIGPPDHALDIVDARIPIAAPSMDRDALRELAAGVARTARAAPGVRRAALELSPAHDALAPSTPLVLLLALDEGASLPAIRAHLHERVPGVVVVPERLAAHVIAEDHALARDTADEVARALRAVTGVGTVWAASGRGAPELRVDLDRDRVARAGLDARRVMAMVRLAADGEVATEWVERGRGVAVRVRVASSLEDLRIHAPAGGAVALRELASIVLAGEGADALRRCGATPCVPLFVDADDAALERTREHLASIELPPGVRLAP